MRSLVFGCGRLILLWMEGNGWARLTTPVELGFLAMPIFSWTYGTEDGTEVKAWHLRRRWCTELVLNWKIECASGNWLIRCRQSTKWNDYTFVKDMTTPLTWKESGFLQSPCVYCGDRYSSSKSTLTWPAVNGCMIHIHNDWMTVSLKKYIHDGCNNDNDSS